VARLVLLRFDSNEAAELFARVLSDPETNGPGMDVNDLLYGVKPEWVIGMPTKACECAQTRPSKRQRGGHKVEGWTKGKTYGWWIHPVKGCGRVSRLVLERFIPNLTNGAYDLLPEILDEPDRIPNDMRRFHDTYENVRTRR
jgi:hypothetical protein